MHVKVDITTKDAEMKSNQYAMKLDEKDNCVTMHVNKKKDGGYDIDTRSSSET